MKTTMMCTLGLILFATVTASGEEGGAAKTTPAAAAPAPTAPTAPTPGATTATPAKIDWDGMDKKQRKAYMKKVVLPAAQKMFAAFDAKKYKKITCVTCHGEGANKDFKMPNPELPKLPVTPEGFGALKAKKPEMVQFMGTKVKPTVASLLGEPEFTPQQLNGFSCYNCHTKDTGGAAKEPTKEPAK